MQPENPNLLRNAAVGFFTFLMAVGILVLVARPQGGGIPGSSLPAGAAPMPTQSVGPVTEMPELTDPEPSLDLPTILPEHFPDGQALPQVTGRPSDVVVATANLYTRLPWPAAQADLDRLASGADLIGLNEVTPERARQIAAWTAQRTGWELVRPTDVRSRWSGSNAVLVRTRTFDTLQRGVVFGSRASMRGYRIDSRWITWVQLREKRSGRPLVYLQTHMDAAVEHNGRPRGNAAPRVRNNVQYMSTLSRMVQAFQTNHEVLVGGDWNVDARADRQVQHPQLPFTRLEARNQAARPGLRSTYSLLGFGVPPTSRYAGGRWIDYLAIWTRPEDEAKAVVTGHQVLTGVNSDHNPLVATVRLLPG